MILPIDLLKAENLRGIDYVKLMPKDLRLEFIKESAYHLGDDYDKEMESVHEGLAELLGVCFAWNATDMGSAYWERIWTQARDFKNDSSSPINVIYDIIDIIMDCKDPNAALSLQVVLNKLSKKYE